MNQVSTYSQLMELLNDSERLLTLDNDLARILDQQDQICSSIQDLTETICQSM